MIKNKTKGTVLANHSNVSSSFIFKFRGLMFSRKINDFGLVFVFHENTKISLHMFFVFFTIDVLFLDKDRKIIEIKEGFKPFALYFPKKEFMYVVELPPGTIRKSKTEINDTITFK
jgi:uncharacterized protein